MTREQAIRELNTFKIGAKSELGETALDMAIKALEQEPCEDAISMEDAIKVLQDNCNHWETNIMLIAIAEDLLKALPPVKPVACIATVKFSKEDIQELVNEKMKDIVVERKKGKPSGKYRRNN